MNPCAHLRRIRRKIKNQGQRVELGLIVKSIVQPAHDTIAVVLSRVGVGRFGISGDGQPSSLRHRIRAGLRLQRGAGTQEDSRQKDLHTHRLYRPEDAAVRFAGVAGHPLPGYWGTYGRSYSWECKEGVKNAGSDIKILSGLAHSRKTATPVVGRSLPFCTI